jgi:hypothetical protein
MNSFSSLFKKEHMSEIILAILFIIYLIMGIKTPEPFSNLIDSLFGKVIILFIVVYMFMHTNSILAILGLFVAFELIRRSSYSTGSYALQHYLPSEEKKSSQLTAFNQFPYTLEQEVVKKMAPLVRNSSNLSKASYKPLLDNLYGASSVTTSNN